MIYTLTMNPALDYLVEVDKLNIGRVNKISTTNYQAGGKGINVSIVLKNLGTDSVALGYLGGFVGAAIQSHLKKMGIKEDMIHVEGNSRINVKIKSKQETELNADGPKISAVHLKQLIDKVKSFKSTDYLIMAGSIPTSVEENIYRVLMQNTKANVIVDTTGKALLDVLQYRPFLIKPNNHELGELFNTSLWGHEEIYKYALKLQDLGARNIIVSMADKGALLILENREMYFCEAVTGTVLNSVGAGDSVVAGFLHQYLKCKDILEAFKFACATGSATAFSTFLATKNKVDGIYNEQTMVKIK